VTSPPESAPVGQILRPLRDLAAYALVGATAVWLLVAIIDLIPDGSNQFGGRTEASFGEFVNLPIVVFPIAAVLLALVVQPRHPKARLIVLVALAEYAVALFFGVFFGLLIGLINLAADAGARAAFMGLLVRLAWLAVLAVAAYATFLIWQRLFTAPRAPSTPGVYGQPPQFNPGAFPGQPGYGPPPPGHPGPPPAPGSFGPTTYGGPGAPPPGSASPFPGAPPHGGTPPPPHGGTPPYPGSQSSAPPFQSPQSAPPFQNGQSAQSSHGPQSAPTAPGGAPAFENRSSAPSGSEPFGDPPSSPGDGEPSPSWNQPAMPLQPHGRPTVPRPDAGPGSEPTQVVPPEAGDDRTEKLDEPRPGFGPAEPDPPRS
jgi:hypothetical protein